MKTQKTRAQIAAEKLRNEVLHILEITYNLSEEEAEWIYDNRSQGYLKKDKVPPHVYAKRYAALHEHHQEELRQKEIRRRNEEIKEQYYERYLKSLALKIVASSRSGISGRGNQVAVSESILSGKQDIKELYGRFLNWLEDEAIRVHNVAVAAGFESEIKEIINLIKTQYDDGKFI